MRVALRWRSEITRGKKDSSQRTKWHQPTAGLVSGELLLVVGTDWPLFRTPKITGPTTVVFWESDHGQKMPSHGAQQSSIMTQETPFHTYSLCCETGEVDEILR